MPIEKFANSMRLSSFKLDFNGFFFITLPGRFFEFPANTFFYHAQNHKCRVAMAIFFFKVRTPAAEFNREMHSLQRTVKRESMLR